MMQQRVAPETATREHGDDRGVTLVELIIYIALSTLVVSLVAATLIGLWTAQSQANSTATSSTKGDVVSRGIDLAMRNATVSYVSSDGSTLAIATNLTGGRTCQGWYVDSAGALHQTMSSTSISLSNAANWPVQATGVVALGGQPYFAPASGNGVTYALGFSGTSTTVPFQATVNSRNAGGTACW